MSSVALVAAADAPLVRLRAKLARAVAAHAPDLTAITSALSKKLDAEERNALVESTIRDWVRGSPEFRTAMPQLAPLKLSGLEQSALSPLPDLPSLALRPLAIGGSGKWNWFIKLTGAELRITADAYLTSALASEQRGESINKVADVVSDEETIETVLRSTRSAVMLKALEEFGNADHA